MSDKPDKKPVNTDSEAVRQHHRLAGGKPVNTGAGGDNGGGKKTQW